MISRYENTRFFFDKWKIKKRSPTLENERTFAGKIREHPYRPL